MKLKIITTILIFSLPLAVNAKIYKCIIADKVSYQSDPCPNTLEKEYKNSAFDGWEFGMIIDAMKRRVRERKIPMSPSSSSIISRYNEAILNGQPKARIYSYNSTLMEKQTRVTLFFTKITEELYQIQVSFYVLRLKPEERKYFYESLYSQLSKKYGKAVNLSKDALEKNTRKSLADLMTSNITEKLVGTLQVWGVNTDNVVTLTYKKNYQTMTSYQVTYKNIKLADQNKREITYDLKQRTDKAIIRDASKL